MKFLSIPNPKKLFRSRKTRSVSGGPDDDPMSFSSGTTSTSTAYDSAESGNGRSKNDPSTPTSVLPKLSGEISPDELSEISSGVYADLVQAFKLIGRDDDGRINGEDLGALLCRVGSDPPSKEELAVMLREVDGDGCISLDEFSALSSAFALPACDSELRGAFDFFDTDHDGRITAEELLSFFTTIGDDRCTLEDCRRMISGVDKNGDGFVCFEDFSLMMERQR